VGVLALKLDKAIARHRLLTDGQVFLDDPNLRPQIEENWRFIFQEPLCPEQPEERTCEPKPADRKHQGTAPRRGRPKRSGSERREGD
jgi:hypothetical protein